MLAFLARRLAATLPVLLVVAVGAFFVKKANWGSSWSEFAPNGVGGIASGASFIFFAYIGFDAVSTTAICAAPTSLAGPAR